MASELQLQRKLLHLFEHVSEPVGEPKGDGKVFYDLSAVKPDNTDNIVTRFGGLTPEISVKVVPRKIPDLTFIKRLPRGEPFSNFIPLHREFASELLQIFMSCETTDILIDTAAQIRDEINEGLFVYALMACTIRKKEFRNIRLPPISEVFPDAFFEAGVLKKVHKETKNSKTGPPKIVYIDRFFSATDKDPENKVAYFREDMGANSHHWHWHLIYPADGEQRDRRGELFFYMHQQIVARCDIERLANGLNRVKPLHNWDEPIPEAYFPKLTMENSGIAWGSRPAGLRMTDIDIKDDSIDLKFQINDLERWRSRIYHAIHQGILEDPAGNKIRINGDNDEGIDLLGNVIEAAPKLSINPKLYGDMHNLGHAAIAFIHDPDRSHRENAGVMFQAMGDMRDPLFFRWHKFVDDMAQEHKATLTPYTITPTPEQKKTKFALTYDAIELESVKVTTQDGPKNETNLFITGWQESDLTLNRGLDFMAKFPVIARVKHIQHLPFSYTIKLNNKSREPQDVVLRIFMAPTYDEVGKEFDLRDQRHFMIELDKFNVKVPPGNSRLERKSSDSAVTVPFERTFRELEEAGTTSSPQFNFCGCGWPDHFLVPRGTKEGMACKLFVMATDWSKDQVEKPADGGCVECSRNAASYCGILDQKYPDKRPMGFPFDRPPPKGVNTLKQLVTPNMKVVDVRVRFRDEIISTRRLPQ